MYGLLINEHKQILISDECRNGFSFTKFPGGGLEAGEGFKEALKREFLEELQLDVEIGELFYFNEFHQPSAFNPKHQVHSFYYFVHSSEWQKITTDQHSVPLTEEGEKHRWLKIEDLSPELFTFPIDKMVVERILVHSS